MAWSINEVNTAITKYVVRQRKRSQWTPLASRRELSSVCGKQVGRNVCVLVVRIARGTKAAFANNEDCLGEWFSIAYVVFSIIISLKLQKKEIIKPTYRNASDCKSRSPPLRGPGHRPAAIH